MRKTKAPFAKPGKSRTKLVPFPAKCADCTPDKKEMFGCGHDPLLRGKAQLQPVADVDLSTCPRYFVETDPAVASVWADLDDYKRGALKDIGRMPAPRVDYLRAAAMAQAEWAAQMEFDLS